MLKKTTVFLLALVLSFSPAFTSLVQAVGINFEGFAPLKYDQTSNAVSTGAALKFSFGNPKYCSNKKRQPLSQIYKTQTNLTSSQKTVLGFAAMAAYLIAIYVTFTDDDPEPTIIYQTTPVVEEPTPVTPEPTNVNGE
jgi:hypothetical protein